MARSVLNGVMYILSTGCQWRALPKDLPPKSTVHDYLMLWDWDGTLERVHHALVSPENPIGPRNRGFSDRDWIPSSAWTRLPFFSFFQHSATASVGAQPSSLSSLLFGINSPR